MSTPAFRGGLVFKVNRLSYHSVLGSRVTKREEEAARPHARSQQSTSTNTPKVISPQQRGMCNAIFFRECVTRCSFAHSVNRQVFQVPYFFHFEPSLGALILWSDKFNTDSLSASSFKRILLRYERGRSILGFLGPYGRIFQWTS